MAASIVGAVFLIKTKYNNLFWLNDCTDGIFLSDAGDEIYRLHEYQQEFDVQLIQKP